MPIARISCRLFVAAAMPILLAGCDDSRRRPTSETWKAEPAVIEFEGRRLDENTPPKDVAIIFLEVLKRGQAIRKAGMGDPKNVERYREIERLIWRFSAADAVLKAAEADPFHIVPKRLSPERAVEIISAFWTPTVAHYLDGIRAETAVESGPSKDERVVRIQAGNPRDRAVLREISESLSGQRDPSGAPLVAGSPLFEQRLREAAVARGVNPSPDATIEIGLTRFGPYWRIRSVKLAPPISSAMARPRAIFPRPSPRPRSTQPTSASPAS